MGEPQLDIKNASVSYGKESAKYLDKDFVNVLYDLVKARELSRQAPNKNLIETLTPINGVYSGYWINKVAWQDPRDSKEYTDEWERTDYDNEEDRLRAIRNINSKIQAYNNWLEKEKEEKGIEATLQWYEQSPFNEWALNFYLTYPSLNQSDEIGPHRTIDNEFLYKCASNMDSANFIIRFNKTAYDWIISMLPKSFNDEKSKFLSDQHLLYKPKLEFENWFMKNGLNINECKSLFDEYIKPEGITDEDISKNLIIQYKEQILRDQEIKREQRQDIFKLKNPARTRLEDMIQNDTLANWIDTNCRFQNGTINKTALGRELNVDRKTAEKLLIDLGQAYLLKPLNPKETGGKYKMVKLDKTKQLSSK